MVKIDSEWLKTFKKYRNELNQSKWVPNGQNQSRIAQNAQNGPEWVKNDEKRVKKGKGEISLNWLLLIKKCVKC